jgi:hypothetical protein
MLRYIWHDCSAERLKRVSAVEKAGIIGGDRKGKKGATKR